jgi:type I restriction enzyme S subunit
VTEEWPEQALGDICTFNYGKALPASARTGQDYPVYGSNGEIGRHDVALTAGPTIVIGRKGSFGEVHYSAGACWPIDTTYYVDQRSTESDLRWLMYRLRSLGLTELNRAAAVPGLNREDAYRQRVRVPPIGEQRRIAAVLDKADELRAKRQTSLALLDSLNESIFLAMFGNPRWSGQEYERRPLGELADLYAGGALPPGSPWSGQTGGYMLAKVSDLNLSGNEKWIQRTNLWSDKAGSRSATCPPLAIVIPKRGGAIGTNKKRLTTRSTVVDPNLMAIAPRTELLEPLWLYEWFQMFDLQSIVSGSSVPQLNKQDLAPLLIALPPLEMQKVFVERCERLTTLREAASHSRSQLAGLFGSLRHRAFAGQL